MNDDSKMTFLARLVAGIIILVIIAIIYIICFALPAHPATYYVKTAANGGSDDSTGLTWGKAWTTISKVNSSMGAGDTVFFATGTWWGQLQPVGGTFSDRTTYACSSFALQNGSGTYHFAKLFGGQKVEGWTIYSGNVYQASYASTSTRICLIQGDSIIWIQDNLVDVTEVGEGYWDNTNDIIYAYVYNLGAGGQDPDVYDMEVTDVNGIDISADNDYITFWGLELKCAKSKGISVGSDDPGWPQDNPDSIFIEHCKITHSGGGAGTNAANIHFPHTRYPTKSSDYCIIRACSLAFGYDYRHTVGASGGHGGAVSIYSVSHLLIESCQVYGYYSGDVIDFKAQTYEPLNDYNVVRYNTIRPDVSRLGIMFWGHLYHDSCYGNILDGRTGLNPIGNSRLFRSIIGAAESDTAVGESVFVFNNTIYNAKRGYLLYDEHFGTNHTYQRGAICKYNIFYNNMNYTDISDLGGVNTLYDTVNDPPMDIDSNLYIYPSGAASKFEAPNDTWLNFAQWQSKGHDVHSSDSTDPGFNNPSAGDFSRPSASGEMNRTYGGKTWTIYGAVQNDGEPPASSQTTKKLAGNVILRGNVILK